MAYYRVRDTIPKPVDAVLIEYHPRVRSLLFHRGLTEADEARRFLRPDYARDTHDPFLMKDMERAVQRILGAIDRSESIIIYNESLARMEKMIEMGFTEGFKMSMNNLENLLASRLLSGLSQ